MQESTPGRAFYNRQVEFLTSGDVRGLVDTQYAPEAEIVSFDFKVKGRQALLEHFEHYIKNLGSFELVSTDNFAETEETVFFEATIRVERGLVRVYNAFVIQNCKATHHFSGRIGFIPS